ncbi:hypothetical protein ACSVDM_11190 [Nocardia sp. JW2]|uniref:hypothetical protein n=1 Tax=Nocardia sp. JW2 TaxID=3450738 RepID=UPI003F43F097
MESVQNRSVGFSLLRYVAIGLVLGGCLAAVLGAILTMLVLGGPSCQSFCEVRQSGSHAGVVTREESVRAVERDKRVAMGSFVAAGVMIGTGLAMVAGVRRAGR